MSPPPVLGDAQSGTGGKSPWRGRGRGGAQGPPLPWYWGIALLPSLTQLMPSLQPPEYNLELLLAPLVATRVKLN